MAHKGSYRSLISNLALIVGMLALIIATAFTPTPVQAFSVTITVTTAADNLTSDGLCSLREAITNANTNANPATYPDCAPGVGSAYINFSSGLGTATILLTSDLPPLSDTAGLTINGAGKITISGNDLYQVFYLNANVPLTLDGLTVAHGKGASSIGGGAYISPGGQMTILNSTFSHNNAAVAGGGVYSHGTLILTNTTFSANSSGTLGGGVYNYDGTLTVTNSTFSGNTSAYGGGLYNGGGILTVTNSIFSGNGATSNGGAIFHNGGTATILGSWFSINTAGSGGGVANVASLTLANSTFFNNTASFGGALFNYQSGLSTGSATILNSTFSNNTTIFSDFGAVNNQAILNLSNTIIANSIGGGDCAGPVVIGTSNNNLIQDPAHSCGLTNNVNGNIIGVTPNLGTAVGYPAYLPLNAGSAAINAGDNAICAAAPVSNTSQNGVVRPNGARCDIGSYEADVTPPVVLSITRADPNPTNAASLTFTVTFSEPVHGVTSADFALTPSGVTGASVSSVSSDTGATRVVTVSTGSGSGTLRLDVADHDAIQDAAGLYLGGTGQGNGSFTSGQVYTINKGGPGPYRAYLPQIRR